jgi:hypothetical protein
MDATKLQRTADFHVTPGRVRVRSLAMRRDAARARRAEIDLAALPGITLARVNPTTGSVLLLFDTEQWTAEALLGHLQRQGYLEADRTRTAPDTVDARSRDLVRDCCVFIGKQLLCAAISAAFPHPVIETLLAVV